MSTTIEQREELIEQLTDSVGNLVDSVTIDAQKARPLPGHAVILIQPPDLDFEGWEIVTIHWSILVIAGTTATQVAAMDTILKVVDKLQSDHINMETAKPVTYGQGSESLAAYEITFNPLD